MPPPAASSSLQKRSHSSTARTSEPSASQTSRQSLPPRKRQKREDELASMAKGAHDRLQILYDEIKDTSAKRVLRSWLNGLMVIQLSPDEPSTAKPMIEPEDHEYDSDDGVCVDNASRLITAYRSFLKKHQSLPAPSVYATHWQEYQDGPNKLLCCRPPSACGIPICTMHDVFGNFFADVQQKRVTAKALFIAKSLCMEMPRGFGSEDDRSREWERLTDPFLGQFRREDRITSGSLVDRSYGRTDSTLYVERVPIAIREMKLEPGSSGDVWFQLSRTYDIVAKGLQNRGSNYARYGAPMFLIGVFGQQLQIFGAIHDGENTIVELLTDALMAVDNPANTDREYRVAIALQALRNGLDALTKLAKLKSTSTTSFPALTPRVYVHELWTFDPSLPPDTTLQFKEPLMETVAFTRLLFTATLSSRPDLILVKLVPDYYGEEVHRHLAEHDLAPALFGSAKPATTCKAYAMEYLPPGSWMILHDFLQERSVRRAYQSLIKDALLQVLNCLQKGGMVHGDLREANIMIQVRENGEPKTIEANGARRAILKVVDLDWAGKAGVAKYPPVLNPDIPWPGQPGEPIQQSDDESMVKVWFRKWFGCDLQT